MLLKRKFNYLVGSALDIETIKRIAAQKAVRACRFHHVTDTGGNDLPSTETSSYITALNRLTIQPRTWYESSFLSQENRRFQTQLQNAIASLEDSGFYIDGENFKNVNVRGLIADEMAIEITDLEEYTENIDAEMGDLATESRTIMDRGFLHPTERLKYRVTEKIQLREMPQHQYRGQRLTVHATNGTITSVSTKRHTPFFN